MSRTIKHVCSTCNGTNYVLTDHLTRWGNETQGYKLPCPICQRWRPKGWPIHGRFGARLRLLKPGDRRQIAPEREYEYRKAHND